MPCVSPYRCALALAAVVVVVCAGAPAARAGQSGLARFEPARGCYLGAYIDFDPTLQQPFVDRAGRKHQLPEGFERTVGKEHAMYFYYMGYGRPLPTTWIHELAVRRKFVHIALQPDDGLHKVQNNAYLVQLAKDMRQSGALIFLRFASEMNGDWVAYTGKPRLYRQKFRLVHDVMARYAPNVAMVWCPFVWPPSTIPQYWPGADVVDWVGINLYNVYYHDDRPDRPAHDESPTAMLWDIYHRYAPTKPIMICEYGATHYSKCDNRTRADYASNRIQELYSALRKSYPRVKCINYFDGNNVQFAVGRGFNDYCVTNHPGVLAAYRRAISAPHFLSEMDGAARKLADQWFADAARARGGPRPPDPGKSSDRTAGGDRGS